MPRRDARRRETKRLADELDYNDWHGRTEETLRTAIERWNKYDLGESKLQTFTEVIEHEAHYSPGYSWKAEIVARVRREDGVEDTLHYYEDYWPGTRLDPPEGEMIVYYESAPNTY